MRRKLTLLIAITVLCISTAAYARHDDRCAGCGKAIAGPSIETNGDRYHENCLLCDYCRQPVTGAYVEHGGKNYHDFCFKSHIALRCVVCGEIIGGRYLLDYWGNAAHPRHEETVPRCDFCRRFLAGSGLDGMRKFPDGRMLCGACAPSAVVRKADARVLMRDVAIELARHGLAVEIRAIELELVGRNKLGEIADSRTLDTRGFVDYSVEKNLFGTVTHRAITIYILSGMPRVQAAGTLAHELMHVWQFVQGRLHVEKTLSEGSANYASYLMLTAIGGGEAEYGIEMMLNDPDPVYGEGFRRVKSFAEREGIPAWLNLLAKKKPILSSY